MHSCKQMQKGEVNTAIQHQRPLEKHETLWPHKKQQKTRNKRVCNVQNNRGPTERDELTQNSPFIWVHAHRRVTTTDSDGVKEVYHDSTTEDRKMGREKHFLDVLSLSVQREHEHG